MKLNFTDEVEADLEAIGDYVANENPFQAVRLVWELRTHCERLVTFPHPTLY